MKTILPFALVTALTAVTTGSTCAADTRCYEMRIYCAAPGKLDALNTRFRDHTCKLFEKHGMVNIGYWLPMTNTENQLVYLLAYPSREAREKSWKEFMADPDWQTAYKESEKDGKLVVKAEPVFLAATDFSPAITASSAAEPRVFELRTYTASPGKLDSLLARFREHTLKLFEKHGMASFGYWTPTEKESGAGEKLIYLLAHKSPEAAAECFKAFRADPDWIAFKKASEDKAGGSLTVQDGVKSEFLVPTDYSPTK
jgi:NIPSNAP